MSLKFNFWACWWQYHAGAMLFPGMEKTAGHGSLEDLCNSKQEDNSLESTNDLIIMNLLSGQK